ncbi:MAG TPA: amidohydrolase family protein [Bryobacteraceae bacterium]|nr:amidohydrolase family protein [Bryobacteraceae bacterium]
MLTSASGYPVVVRVFALLICCLPVFSSSVTIRNVNVVDVETGDVRKGVNVVIDRGYITSVGVAPKPKSSIDGKGRYLIPGLWDMHVHLWPQKALLGSYVASGVLGVRDMGSNFARTKEWRESVEAARKIGPRIYTSGTPVDGPGLEVATMEVVRAGSPDAARRAVDAIDRQGVDFVNILSALSRDSYYALAQRARVIRAVFAGHVPDAVTVSQALDARQKSMEHLLGIAFACSSEEAELREARLLAIDAKDEAALSQIRLRSYNTFSEAKATDLFKRMARFDVWQTPTLTVRKQAEAEYEFNQRVVKLMQSYGVGLLAGTDSGEPHVAPGSSLHKELEAFVKAGLTPAQALRTATINPARYFGSEVRAGSIAPGKRADLVLLDANPLDDIRNTRRIASVIVRGRLLDGKELKRVSKETEATWRGDTPFTEVLPKPPRQRRKPRKR